MNMAKDSKYQLPWQATLFIGAVLGYVTAIIVSRPQLDATSFQIQADSISKHVLIGEEYPEENQDGVLSASITIIILLLVVLTLVFERVKEAVEESAERIFEPVIEGLVRHECYANYEYDMSVQLLHLMISLDEQFTHETCVPFIKM